MCKPIRDYVLVKPFKRNNISEGGIVIPDTIESISNKVMIIEMGNGTLQKPMRLKKGNIGFRVKNWGTEIIIDQEKHYLMGQDAIIALQN